MSTHYESVHIVSLYPDAFHVAAPVSSVGREVWPRQPGVFIRAAQSKETEEAEQAEQAADADKPPRELPSRELVAGQFGLVPRWVKSASDAPGGHPKCSTCGHPNCSTPGHRRLMC